MKITCPDSSCRTPNEASVEFCTHCHAPLRGYVTLLNQQKRLFNQGLDRVAAQDFQQARELFAAVVHWCPMDLEARNALGAACFTLKEYSEAHEQWSFVFEHAALDSWDYILAKKGLETLQHIGRSQKKESKHTIAAIMVGRKTRLRSDKRKS